MNVKREMIVKDMMACMPSSYSEGQRVYAQIEIRRVLDSLENLNIYACKRPDGPIERDR